MALRLSARLGALGVAALAALGLMLAGRQITASGWYSAHSAYRTQVDALLEGRLALSEAPEALFHDFAWTDSGVHQVWGLGVPVWQTPFELMGRAAGLTPFPDRVALLAWLALMLYVLAGAWHPPRRDGEHAEPWLLGAGAVLITALLPAFTTIILGRVGVYEEAAIYAYAAAMILLGGMLRLHAEPARWRFLLLLACAGLAGFMRPTTWCYGLATAIVASVLWISRNGRRGLVEVALGGVLFAAGGASLYATNTARFGDGFEFGHRLNLQSLTGNLYATRFSYPMERASLPEAALELAASLFDRPEQRARGSFYQKNLHHGVSKKPRWREYYFTTFSWGYVPLLLIGLVVGGLAWRRRDGPPSDPYARWLVLWAVIALIPLLAFYLRAPFVSSRYQLDLAPAFAALLVITWRAAAHRLATIAHGPIIGGCLLAALWVAAIFSARTAQPRTADPIDRAAAVRAMAPITQATRAPRRLSGAYDLADPWLPIHTDLLQSFDRCVADRCLHGERAIDSEQWVVTEWVAGKPVATHHPVPVIYLNLYGWNLETGQMPPATYAFIDDPAFVELEVSTVDGAPADWERDVRVAVGLTHLRFAGATPAARGTKLRFEASGLPRGLQVAFFAFGPDDQLHQPTSRFAVHRIQWR